MEGTATEIDPVAKIITSESVVVSSGSSALFERDFSIAALH